MATIGNIPNTPAPPPSKAPAFQPDPPPATPTADAPPPAAPPAGGGSAFGGGTLQLSPQSQNAAQQLPPVNDGDPDDATGVDRLGGTDAVNDAQDPTGRLTAKVTGAPTPPSLLDLAGLNSDTAPKAQTLGDFVKQATQNPADAALQTLAPPAGVPPPTDVRSLAAAVSAANVPPPPSPPPPPPSQQGVPGAGPTGQV